MRVISGDAAIDELYADIEGRALELLARQQPVASDLRVLITSLRMVADLERMGDMARARRQGRPPALSGVRRPAELHAHSPGDGPGRAAHLRQVLAASSPAATSTARRSSSATTT